MLFQHLDINSILLFAIDISFTFDTCTLFLQIPLKYIECKQNVNIDRYQLFHVHIKTKM
jgi:hypothetical protein